jgi:hypothetical protein
VTRRNRLSCSLCPLLCRKSNTGRRFCDEVRNGLRLRASEEITCSTSGQTQVVDKGRAHMHGSEYSPSGCAERHPRLRLSWERHGIALSFRGAAEGIVVSHFTERKIRVKPLA